MDIADSPAEDFFRNMLGEDDLEGPVEAWRWLSTLKYEFRLEPASDPGREESCGSWSAPVVDEVRFPDTAKGESCTTDVLVVVLDTAALLLTAFRHSKTTSPRAAVAAAVSAEIKGASFEVHSLTIVSSDGAHRFTVQV